MNRRSAAVMNWRNRTKKKLIDYKGGKCEICGYDKNVLSAYHFHHVNPDEKDFGIGGKSLKFESMLNELDKCILLCANCHAEIHWKQQQFTREKRHELVKDIRLKPRFCVYCERKYQPSNSDQKFCTPHCAGMSYRRVERPELNQILSDVSELGWCGAGRKYGVTDNCIRKWIKRYEKNEKYHEPKRNVCSVQPPQAGRQRHPASDNLGQRR